jgi:hypothetical protein
MKIILPVDKDKRNYILSLYRNKNNFHNMNNQDINNLIKLINIGKLDDTDYPIFKKKNKKITCTLDGYCFSSSNYSQI